MLLYTLNVVQHVELFFQSIENFFMNIIRIIIVKNNITMPKKIVVLKISLILYANTISFFTFHGIWG